MFNGIINSIPIVGHVNTLRLYLSGDEEETKRSFYEANRSLAVIGGGAAGAILGPAGIAAGAAAGGAAVDAATTLITDKPVGAVSGFYDITRDISQGKTPIESSIRTGLIIGGDIIGGHTGPGLAKCSSKAITESIRGVKTVAGTRLAHGATSCLLEDNKRPSRSQKYRRESSSSDDESPRDQQSSNNQSGSGQTYRDSPSSSNNNRRDRRQDNRYQQRHTSGPGDFGGAGGRPPNKNNNDDDKKKKEKSKFESHLDKFLMLFWDQGMYIKLEDVAINGKKIFKDINEGQKRELIKLIKNINNNYSHLGLGNIVSITEALLRQVNDDQVTSHNFVNVAKFVLACLCDMITEIMESYSGSAEDYKIRLAEVAYQIIFEDYFAISTIFRIFKSLMAQILDLMPTIDPTFVNAIAGVYHYYKHKFIKSKNILLTLKQYFDLASKALKRFWSLPKEMIEEENPQQVVYQIYDAKVGRRLKIVIKLQYNGWTLSSCYYEDDIYEDDKDGDEWVNGKKVPRHQ